MDERQTKALGKPDIQLLSLQIWVHGRQFPDHHDYWDGNWLRITAHCGGNGASVFATGPIIHLSEIYGWRDRLESLNQSLNGNANLECLEPYIEVKLKAQTLGQITMEVSITPDHMSQRHWFEFSIDQTFLGPLISKLNSLLAEYPLRGDRNQPSNPTPK
jgi:hypothetical protein